MYCTTPGNKSKGSAKKGQSTVINASLYKPETGATKLSFFWICLCFNYVSRFFQFFQKK